MNRFDKQETIMLIAMCLVVMVVMFGATVAWFVGGSSPVTISKNELNMDDLGDLYVRVKIEEPGISTPGEMIKLGAISTPGEIDTPEDVNTSGEVVTARVATAGLATAGEQNELIDTESEIDSEGYAKIQSIGTGDNIKYSIDMHIVKQENIQENTLAPGAYGQIKFKLYAKSTHITGYKISVMPIMKILDSLPNNLTKQQIEELVKSHIKFYAKFDTKPDSGSDDKIYMNPIMYSDECIFDYENAGEISQNQGTQPSYIQDGFQENAFDYVFRDGLTGAIKKDELVYVTLYWYWPYEYVDIPECLHHLDNDSIYFNEFSKYVGKSENSCIETYDWDDTYIGNFVSKLTFHFDVETRRES